MVGWHATIKKEVVSLKGTIWNSLHFWVLSDKSKEQNKHIWCAASKEEGEIYVLVFKQAHWGTVKEALILLYTLFTLLYFISDAHIAYSK